MSEANNQFNSALNAAEEARQKAQQDAARHAAEITARTQYHQQLAERATKMSAGNQSFTENVAAAARSTRDFLAPIGQGLMTAGSYGAAGLAMVGAHVYSGASRGASYIGGQLSQAAPSMGAAFGVGDFSITGPGSRGISGPYQQAGQSFFGMMYEGGIGGALNTATAGMFFRDVNQVVGLPPALVRQRAQEEMSMRARSVGNAFTEALPFSSVMGFRFAGMASDTRRDVAERLSFVTGTGGDNLLAGGRGVSATGQLTTTIMESLERSGRQYDRTRGYSLSSEEERSFRRAALNMFDTPELQNLTKAPSSEVKRKMTQAREVVHKLTDDLRISAGEAEKLTEQFGKIFGPDILGRLSAASKNIISGGAAGGLSGTQIMTMMAQQTQSGYKLGMGDTQATQFAQSFMAERGAVLAQRRAGLITTGDLYMYGGSNADEAAANLAQANRRIGSQFGMGDPGRAAMFANRSGNNYMNQLAAGANAGGMIGFLGAQANVTVADPYAALRSQYDPDAKQRAATTGRLAAFQSARQQAKFTHLFKTGDPAVDRKNARALSIQAFQQSAGIEDPVEAARQFDMMELAEMEMGDSKKAFLYNEMQQVGAYGMDIDKAKQITETILKATGGDVNKFANATDIEKRRMVNEALVTDVGLTTDEKRGVDARLQATMNAYGNAAPATVTEEMRQREQEVALNAKFGLNDVGVNLDEATLGVLGGAVGGTLAGAGAGLLGGAVAGATIGSIIPGFGTVVGGLIGGAVGLVGGAAVGLVSGAVSALDQEGDIEKTAQQLLAAGVPKNAVNARLRGTGYRVDDSGNLVDDDDGNKNADSLGGTGDVHQRLAAMTKDIINNKGKLAQQDVQGMELEAQKERVLAMTGDLNADTYLSKNKEFQEKIGVKDTGDGTFGYTEDQRAQLMQDKNFMADVKKAAEITGDKELLKDLESGRQKGGTREAAANRLMASDTLQEAMKNIRLERELGVKKAEPLGSSKDKPMYVKDYDD